MVKPTPPPNPHEMAGRIASGVVGLLLILLGSVLTVWAGAAGKSLSAVGIGGVFLVGALLTLVGLVGVVPSSLSFNKDGLTVQLVAETSNEVKKSVEAAGQDAAKNPEIKAMIKDASSDQEVEAVATMMTRQILDSLPATSDLTQRALNRLR